MNWYCDKSDPNHSKRPGRGIKYELVQDVARPVKRSILVLRHITVSIPPENLGKYAKV